jgi:hypothetical protein
MKWILVIAALCTFLAFSGCTPTVKVKHEIQPIYITVDVNVKVEEQLNDFFDFEDGAAEESGKEEPEGGSSEETGEKSEAGEKTETDVKSEAEVKSETGGKSEAEVKDENQ